MDSKENKITMPKKKNTWLLPVFIVIVLILIGLFVWQNLKNRELNNYFEQEQVELQSDYRLLLEEYDSLQINNNYDSILYQLDIEQQRVAQLLDEIETMKATNAVKLREYRKELTTMRKVMKHYVVQIDSLNTVNEALEKENEYVKKQYKEATNAVIQLEEEKQKLNKTIEIASQLEIRDLFIDPQNSKGRSMKKLSKTERFKISFSILKNITTETGNKTVYLRITSPQKEVLPSPDNGQFNYEDTQLDYSAKRKFEYEAEDVSIDVYYVINQFLFAGEYEFDLFVNGNHIGHQTILLKN